MKTATTIIKYNKASKFTSGDFFIKFRFSSLSIFFCKSCLLFWSDARYSFSCFWMSCICCLLSWFWLSWVEFTASSFLEIWSISSRCLSILTLSAIPVVSESKVKKILKISREVHDARHSGHVLALLKQDINLRSCVNLLSFVYLLIKPGRETWSVRIMTAFCRVDIFTSNKWLWTDDTAWIHDKITN